MKCLLSYRSSNWCGRVVEELQFLTYGLLVHIKRTYALRGPLEFANALANTCLEEACIVSSYWGHGHRNNFRVPETAIMPSLSKEAESSKVLNAFLS